MSTRSVSGTPPSGFSPHPAPDDADAVVPSRPDEATATPDGIDDPGTFVGSVADPFARTPGAADDLAPGGLAARPDALDRIGTRTLVLDDSPALLARVTAGFAIVDDCVAPASAP